MKTTKPSTAAARTLSKPLSEPSPATPKSRIELLRPSPAAQRNTSRSWAGTPLVSATPASGGVLTIGIDLGDKKHSCCVLDAQGGILAEFTLANNREALQKLSRTHPAARIIIEVGMQSPWISRLLQSLGHEVIVANARKVRAIYQNERKSDQTDARMLARIGRMDSSLLHPITHRNELQQRDLLQIKLRDALVRQRVNLISSVRFMLKSLGLRLASPGTSVFSKHARAQLEEKDASLLPIIEPTLQVLDMLNEKIRGLDRQIDTLCEQAHPQTRRLRQIPGVGPITALAYALIIGEPQRFTRSRDVGPYLGLVPRRDQSGALDKQLAISKTGDSYLRRLLVGAAHYILGPFGPPSDLREHGLHLAARGGRGAKNKAVVAIARKLAVLLHALWQSGSDYQPVRTRPERANPHLEAQPHAV